MPVIHIENEQEYDQILKTNADKLVVVDFTAKWCGPCQRIAPLYEKLSDTYRQSRFVKVDVDECPIIAAHNDVAAMPTFLFVKKGKEVDRVRGADPDTLEEKIKQHAGPAACSTFVGEGHRLGGESMSASAPPQVPVAGAAVDAVGVDGEKLEIAQALMNVDHSKPLTKINIRMADGSRFTVTLNLTHMVSHIREFIFTVRPDQFSRTFSLMTTFPSKELTDESVSVEDAKLANGVVFQKMK